MTKYLIIRGANPNIKNSLGDSALSNSISVVIKLGVAQR